MMATLYAASSRSSTPGPGRLTHHSLSFGVHYDPDNLFFGPMVAHNDEFLQPASGYPDHPHTDLEIVTWVLEGVLVHTDSSGRRHDVHAGQAQVLSAGDGVVHSEVADAASGPCRFIQTWLRPDSPGGASSYALSSAPLGGVGLAAGLVEVAGPETLPINAAGARLLAGRIEAGTSLDLPESLRQHLFVASGSLEVGDETGSETESRLLRAGDALRMEGAHRSGPPPTWPTGLPADLRVTAREPVDLVVWSFSR